MGYYQERHNALIDISTMYLKGMTEDEILYTIETKYGFGISTVRKRIALMDRIEARKEKNAQ